MSHERPRGVETILLIEDEAGVRHFVRDALRQDGYTVLDAPNAAEGLSHCIDRSRQIDVLITDVILPGVTGPEIAQQLTAIRPDMKVLYISGYVDDIGIRTRIKDAQAAFLQKPFTPLLLTQTVRDLLESSK